MQNDSLHENTNNQQSGYDYELEDSVSESTGRKKDFEKHCKELEKQGLNSTSKNVH